MGCAEVGATVNTKTPPTVEPAKGDEMAMAGGPGGVLIVGR